nr:unnamed protein product [Callosobruchus chinensis]
MDAIEESEEKMSHEDVNKYAEGNEDKRLKLKPKLKLKKQEMMDKKEADAKMDKKGGKVAKNKKYAIERQDKKPKKHESLNKEIILCSLLSSSESNDGNMDTVEESEEKISHGQFNVKLDYVRNCGSNNVIVVDGTVAGQKFASEFCTIASLYKPAQQVLNIYNFPKQCPLPAKQGCANPSKSLNISKYRKYLRFLIGTFTGAVHVDHDTGTSCFQFSITISRR